PALRRLKVEGSRLKVGNRAAGQPLCDERLNSEVRDLEPSTLNLQPAQGFGLPPPETRPPSEAAARARRRAERPRGSGNQGGRPAGAASRSPAARRQRARGNVRHSRLSPLVSRLPQPLASR